MIRLKVFVSSVQKELQEERAAIGSLLTTDPFLNQCAVPRIFEKYPAPLRPNPQAYLQLLQTCHVYLLVLANEYGVIRENGLSATHQEYRHAQKLGLPTLVCVKSGKESLREDKVRDFFSEIQKDNHTYSRYDTIESLQKIVRDRLIEYLQSTYDTLPTPLQNDQAKDLFRIATPFERKHISNLTWKDLDHDLARQLAAIAEEKSPDQLTEEILLDALRSRGYLWYDAIKKEDRPTVAGSLLLASSPSKALPQTRVQMDAFVGTEPDASPLDSVIIDLPLPLLVDRTIAFVRRNTRKPLVIKGSRRIEKEVLPSEAIREAIVNAVAHRDYEETGSKVIVELFADRFVVSSPGQPPGDQKMETIQSGRARSKARNPLTVQGLAFFGFMEERGSGIRRIREAMLKNGLDEPEFELVDGEFIVTLLLDNKLDLQPSGFAGQTKVWESDPNLSINERSVLNYIVENGFGTTSLCVEKLKLSRGTIVSIFKRLTNEGYLRAEGAGRGKRYFVV